MDDKFGFMPVIGSHGDVMVPGKQIKRGKPLVPIQRVKHILDVAHGVRVLDRHSVKWATVSHYTVFDSFFY